MGQHVGPISNWLTMANVGRFAGSTGNILAGNVEAERGRYVARQHESNAKASRAAASREVSEWGRQTRLAQSRAQALGAAQGGDTTDAGMSDVLADLDREGEFRALDALYRGHTRASGFEGQGSAARHRGRQNRLLGYGGAAQTWLSGFK